MILRKGVLKISSIFTREHSCQSLYFCVDLSLAKTNLDEIALRLKQGEILPSSKVNSKRGFLIFFFIVLVLVSSLYILLTWYSLHAFELVVSEATIRKYSFYEIDFQKNMLHSQVPFQ